MGKWLRLLISSVLACLANSATPADTAPPTVSPDILRWQCWYDRQTHIVCRLETAPERSAPAILAPSPHLPETVKTLRTNPGAFRGRFVLIPMFTEPLDPQFAAQLARAGVCGSRPDCIVDYRHTPPPADQIATLMDIPSPNEDPD